MKISNRGIFVRI